MIESMTGYGKAEINIDNASFIIEIRALNSKNIDINVKAPSCYKDKEIDLRKMMAKKLKRGKIELSIWREKTECSPSFIINTELLSKYHKQILKLKEDLNLKNNTSDTEAHKLHQSEIIPILLKMPDAFIKGKEKINKNEWSKIKKGIDDAILDLSNFRTEEGENLKADITLRICKITELLEKITPFEKARIEKVKNNLRKKILDIKKENFDKNRFEQELIYYLEKQDITEEEVRLDSHLNYFISTMNTDSPNGKKLGFIAQEIGREINTIGSKSLDSDMQRIVVQMKDELEKIKEQLLNIL